MYTGLNNLGLTGLATSFSPSNLFTNGEGGVHFETYDPQTLLTRRNQLTYSSQFGVQSGGWTWGNILSVTAKADGVGDYVVPNATNVNHLVSQSVASVGVPNVWKVRAKKSAVYGFVAVAFSSGAQAAWFDLVNGVKGTVVGGTATMDPAPDAPGYYDCVFTAVPTGALSSVYVCNANGSTAFAGDGVSGIYLARAQLEWNTTTPSAYQEVTDWNTEYMAAALESIGMWQDSTGTTPVTAVEQPVGLWLDGKAGKWTRGVNVVLSGAASWSRQDSNETLTDTGDGGIRIDYVGTSTYMRQIVAVTPNVLHEFVFRYVAGANVANPFGAVRNTDDTGTVLVNSTNGANGVVRLVFVPTTATVSLRVGTTVSATPADCTFYGIECRPVIGNHATQSGSTKRPLLSARVNLLTKTEQLADSAWAKAAGGTAVAPTITDNFAVGPNGEPASRVQFNNGAGGTNADVSYIAQSPGAPAGASTGKVWLKTNDGSTKTLTFRPYNTLRNNVVVTGDWQLFSMPSNPSSPGSGWQLVLYGDFQLGTADILVASPEQRTDDDWAKNIPVRQRVNTSTDYDTVGFPHYLKFDGIDDALQTGSIDLSSFDKISVWAGSTKGSDSAASVLTEFTATSSTTAGSFAIFAPDSAASTYAFRSRGATLGTNAIASGYAAPNSYVVTGLGDISGDLQDIRIDGASANTSTTDQGTGNFANDALNIGSRNNTSLFHNGRLYSLTVRASTTPTSESAISSMNRYVGNLMKIFF